MINKVLKRQEGQSYIKALGISEKQYFRAAIQKRRLTNAAYDWSATYLKFCGCGRAWGRGVRHPCSTFLVHQTTIGSPSKQLLHSLDFWARFSTLRQLDHIANYHPSTGREKFKAALLRFAPYLPVRLSQPAPPNRRAASFFLPCKIPCSLCATIRTAVKIENGQWWTK